MEPAHKNLTLENKENQEMEPAHKKLTLTVPNGVLKKKNNLHHHHHHHQQQQQQQQQQLVRPVAAAVYRECLKNHAASLGGHALDGCGEFMVSSSSNPSDPTSLTCAACGCHRNFHRRLLLPNHPHQQQQLLSENQQNEEKHEGEGDGQDGADDGDEIDDGNEGETGDNSSAPHMLLALSTGISSHPQAQSAGEIQKGMPNLKNQNKNDDLETIQLYHHHHDQDVVPGSKKRSRTRFSPEQKERMQELSERLGWRMQKRDEALVEERCREIGVSKGVFKVWMHNNKHNFVHPYPRNATLTVAADGPGPSISTVTSAAALASPPIGGNGNENGNGIGITVRANGSA